MESTIKKVDWCRVVCSTIISGLQVMLFNEMILSKDEEGKKRKWTNVECFKFLEYCNVVILQTKLARNRNGTPFISKFMEPSVTDTFLKKTSSFCLHLYGIFIENIDSNHSVPK